EPADSGTLLGALSGDLVPVSDALRLRYAGLLEQHGLRIRLQVAGPEGVRYYLASPAGRGPVELAWGLLSLLGSLLSRGGPAAPPREATAFHALLLGVHALDKAFVQLGPLVVVRTPEALQCGVLTVSEARCFDTDRMLADLPAAAARLQALPPGRFHD